MNRWRPSLAERLQGGKVDLVLSDMAPNLSGVGVADAARIMHVCELALAFSESTSQAPGRPPGEDLSGQWLQPAGDGLQEGLPPG